MIRFWQNDLAKIAHIFSTFPQHIFLQTPHQSFFRLPILEVVKQKSDPLNGKIDTFEILDLKVSSKSL